MSRWAIQTPRCQAVSVASEALVAIHIFATSQPTGDHHAQAGFSTASRSDSVSSPPSTIRMIITSENVKPAESVKRRGFWMKRR